MLVLAFFPMFFLAVAFGVYAMLFTENADDLALETSASEVPATVTLDAPARVLVDA